MPAPRILLADADAPTRVGLGVALGSAGFDVVGEASEAGSAVAATLDLMPDAVILATGLPGGGIEAARRISQELPAVRIVLLSDDPGGEELLEAVLAGASGYMGRDVGQARLPTALRGVLAGEVALPRRYTQRLLEELRGRRAQRDIVASRAKAALTDREWEVLQLLADGASTAEIARRLKISAVTVRRHASAVVAKLDLDDRASAAALLRRPAAG
jgi:DNA-binding NarL/FixJ family response regulator